MKRLCASLMILLCSYPVLSQDCYLTPGWEAMQIRDISLSQDGVIFSREVRVADDGIKRAAGYQWICPVQAGGTAVLFVFPKNVPSSFHMRNVFVPLEIHFFDEKGHQVDAMVMQAEPPGHSERPRYYQSSRPFKYALEIALSKTHELQSEPARLRLLVESLN